MNGIKTKVVLSRLSQLAVALGTKVSSVVHTDIADLEPGVVLGKTAGGDYRAYAEAVLSAASNGASDALSFNPASALLKHFRVGDTIEGVGGDALGEIAAINYTTGAVTLTANAATNAVTGAVRIVAAECDIAEGKGRICKDFAGDEGLPQDYVLAAYVEGFFHKDQTTITDAALAAMSAVDLGDNEVRLK